MPGVRDQRHVLKRVTSNISEKRLFCIKGVNELIRYRSSILIGNTTVNYTVTSHKGYKKPAMRFDNTGLRVIVPESYGSAQTDKFIADNSEWIAAHEEARKNGTGANDAGKRTAAEFETLTKTVFTRMFHTHAPAMLCDSAMPDIRFRHMKTVIVSKSERKNELTFSRSLTYSDKDAVTFAAAYGFSLLCGEPGSSEFLNAMDTVCPGWKKLRSKLPESLQNSVRRY